MSSLFPAVGHGLGIPEEGLATSRAVLMDKYRLARGRAKANFSFYFGATNDNLDEIKCLDPKQSCGVKVFMGSSTGSLLVADDAGIKAEADGLAFDLPGDGEWRQDQRPAVRVAPIFASYSLA